MPEAAPRLRIHSVEAWERPVPLRLPFRFGVATVREARQAFVRVRVEGQAGHSAQGWAAELMVPKWFDKDPALSHEDNERQLRGSIAAAIRAQPAGADTAFRLARAVREACGAETAENGLVAGYGPALLERAVMDGVCHLVGAPFAHALRENLFGIDLARELPGLDTGAFLSTLAPAAAIHARHTLGLADALAAADVPAAARLNDGLPESLEEAVARYGHRYFKVKVSGDADADLARLRGVARVLEPLERYRVTLDGNEQFPDAPAARDFLARVWADPALERFRSSILYVEQPIRRDRALACDVGELAAFAPLVADESDATDAAFAAARARGYAGISSKTCKGVYRALLNRARCEVWNAAEPGAGHFVAAEDLTCQAGLSVQQDLLLASAIGCTHSERNGHHYADGMVGASDAELDAFAAAHADLYERSARGLHLRIEGGRIALGSLGGVGFASGATPDPATLSPLELDP